VKRSVRFQRCLSWLLLAWLLLLPALAFGAAPACPVIGVGPVTLPSGVIGTAYSQTLTATSGQPPAAFTPAAFTVDVGSLPPGLLLNAATGELSGTPSANGDFEFAISASDANGCSGGRYYRVTVACGSFSIAPVPPATVGTAYDQALVASGGVAPYTFALAASSPPLPLGLALSGGHLSGTAMPGSGGAYTPQIDVTDATSCAGAPVALPLTVNENLAITSADHTTFTVGTAGTFNVLTTGYPAATLAMSGTLPTGVTFTVATGVLSGTPAAGTGGTYALTFTATNGVSPPAVQNFTLTVDDAPAITSANATTFTVGTAGTFTVTATGFPTPTLAVAGPLPSGVTFNAATGVLSGTPAAGTGGTHPITFTASNGVGTPASQSFTLTVDEAPAITSANTASFNLNAPSSFTVTATGFPTPTLSQTGALPTGITFDAATGVLSGTPAAGSGGVYPLVFTASNGIGTAATQNFTLHVVDGPAITSPNTITFTVGTAGTFTVTATGSPTPTLSETGALPGGVTFDAATGVLSGTPAAGTGGSYAITFTATNGIGTPATQNFTLVVNEAAQITSANATTFAVGAAGTFTVTATGHPTPTLSLVGTLPAGVTFTAATGTLAGTPAAGTGGTYALTITATNGVGAPATQNFTLTVDEAPAITSAAAATFTVGTAGTFTVTATGHPAPTLAEAGALPAGVTFNAATGVLSGTPAAGTGGTYALTFTASNGIGAPATQNFTLTVNEAPQITSAAAATFTIGAPNSFTVTATGFPAPTLAEAGALPSGVTFNAATGVLSGTPAAGSGGTYPITFTAANGVNPQATQSFVLTVNQPAAITSANATTFVVGTPGSFTVTATGSPNPTLAESGALPSGVTFNPATGLLSGTPAAGTGGTYPITFTATNGIGAPAVQAFTLTVNQAPAITSGNAASFPIGNASNFAVTSTGFPTPALSAAGALPSGVTFSDNGSGNGSLSGTPGAGTAGIYPITLTATNGVGSPATQAFTLTVSCPAITVSGSLPDGLYQTTYGPQTFTQSGGVPAITWSASGLPAGLSINAGNGQVSGSPTTTTSGTSVTVTASDAYQCTGTLTIASFKVRPVATNDTFATFGNTPLYAAVPGPATPYVASANRVLSNDAGPAPLSASLGTAPANGTVVLSADGSLVYTPNAGYAGSDSFTYVVSDGNGVNSAPATVSVTVGPVVWYVNASGGNGDGRASSPFNTLASASSSHQAGHVIFVESGATSTTTPGAITLKANASLWGQGAALPLPIANTGATSKPLLTGTVTLAGSNTTVSSLDISTGAATGLTNTGTITSVTVQNDVTVTTTTGTAVNLNAASGTLGFTRISSTGAAHGINLTNVGGTFTIAGDGSAAANGSGGTIANSTTEGILSSGGVTLSLRQINVTNSGTSSLGPAASTGSGIKVTGAGGFALAYAKVTDTAGGGQDDGVYLINTGGNVSITNSQITGSPHNGVHLDNTSVNVTAFTLSGNTIGSQPNDGATTFGNNGVLFDMKGSTQVAAATIQGNTFSNIYATALQAQAGGTANIQGMTIGGAAGGQANTFSGNNIALDLDQDNSASFTFNVLNNAMNGHYSHAMNVFTTQTSTGGALTGKIDGNTIGTEGVIDSGSAIGNGLRLNINGQTHAVLTVSNNLLNEIPNGRGIEMIGRLGSGAAAFKVVGNTVKRPNGSHEDVCGLGSAQPCPLASVWTSALNGNNVCSIITGNTAYDPASWAAGGEAAFALSNNASTLRLEGTAANAAAQITGNNTITNLTGAPVLVGGTVSIVPAGTCGAFP
jgi:hypothetical protein